MNAFTTELLSDLNQQLKTIQQQTNQPLLQTEQSIKACITALEKLKTQCLHHHFETKEAEIEFFKELKPQLVSQLIYYNEIYSIETTKPLGAVKTIKKHYTTYLNRLQFFQNENAEFYKYVRSGNTYLDKKYFVRGKHDIKLTIDSFYFQSDSTFSTSHDYKMAQLLAHQELEKYLNTQIASLKNTALVSEKPNGLTWTASKVALVELLYALHTEGSFNNGRASLKEIMTAFESAFQIELGQFNRIYLEIRNRKTIDTTQFLNTLRDKLILRIDQADEK